MDKKTQQRERLLALLEHDEATFNKWMDTASKPLPEFMAAYVEHKVIKGFVMALGRQYFGQ